MIETVELESRLKGSLLGTALGDALGMPCEGLSSGQISRRFGKIESFHLLGSIGFVSDDTEQSALLAQSIIKEADEAAPCARKFQVALLFWFMRLPCGVGLATLRACLKIALGFRCSGVRSAGNGSAMRAGILGAYFYDDELKRREFGTAICQTTHTDKRALAGALFVGEIAALAVSTKSDSVIEKTEFLRLVEKVEESELKKNLELAASLAEKKLDITEAARQLKVSGYVLHSVPIAFFAFLRYRQESPLEALSQLISVGGDTDSNAAILGGWLGALKGEAALPQELISKIENGPFGPDHLRKLAECLCAVKSGKKVKEPSYNWVYALIRNLFFFGVVLFHVLLRILLSAFELLVR